MKYDKILTFDKHNKCFATLVVISYQHERGHIYTRQGSCCWVGLGSLGRGGTLTQATNAVFALFYYNANWSAYRVFWP